MFYHVGMRPEYREEPCRSALNRVKGMMFGWSLNPYMGCAHQCTFCYVRAFERRADRPSDDRYGTSIRVKTNVAEVLRRELARKSWKGEVVAIGAATDPYQPAEGFYRLTRGCLQVLAEAANPFSIITRGPMVVRDVDVLAEAAARAKVHVTFSVPTLDEKIWRLTEPNTPPPRQRLRALATLRAAGIDAGVGMAPILPGLSDRPELLADVVKAARDLDLDQPPVPATRDARAFPRPPGAGLAGARPGVRTPLPWPGLPRQGGGRAAAARGRRAAESLPGGRAATRGAAGGRDAAAGLGAGAAPRRPRAADDRRTFLGTAKRSGIRPAGVGVAAHRLAQQRDLMSTQDPGAQAGALPPLGAGTVGMPATSATATGSCRDRSRARNFCVRSSWGSSMTCSGGPTSTNWPSSM
jgi:DNA repair photolyase